MEIRIENGYEIKPDAYLREANLEEANLEGAYLGKADLRESCLMLANLERANLKHANLERSNLLGVKIDDGQGNVYECQKDGWGIVGSISA